MWRKAGKETETMTETLAEEAVRAEAAKGMRLIADNPVAAWGCLLPLLVLILLAALL